MPRTTTPPYLASPNAQNDGVISALDKIEGAQPRAVVASHKRPEKADNARIVEETRHTIRDFDG